MVKNLPAMQETQVQSLRREDPVEKGVETRSSVLARRIPWTEEPGGLHSTGCKESDMTEQLTLSHTSTSKKKKAPKDKKEVESSTCPVLQGAEHAHQLPQSHAHQLPQSQDLHREPTQLLSELFA